MASPRQRLRLGYVPDALLLVLLLAASAAAAPQEATSALFGPSEIPVEVQMPSDQVIYDQRQNGSENLRVQMSGVTVVLAPAEALLSLPDLMDTGAKPKLVQPSQPKSRLTNLLMGFLSKGHH